MLGHVDNFRPADQVEVTEEARRTDAAATPTTRVKRRIVRPVADLLTFEEFEDQLAVRILEYQVRHHRSLGMAPEIAYHQRVRPRELRPASDALLMLNPTVLTVGKGGIEWRNRPFAAHAGGRRIGVGEQILCRPDPLARGLFAEIQGATYFLPDSETWSRMQVAENLAIELNAYVKELSERAKDALERVQDQQIADRDAKRAEREEASRPPVPPLETQIIPQDSGDVAGPLVAETMSVDTAPVEATVSQGEEIATGTDAPKKSRKPSPEKPASAKPVPPKPAAAERTGGLPRGIVTSRRNHLKLVD